MQRLRVGHWGPLPHPAFLRTCAEDPALEPVALPEAVDAAVTALAGCGAY